MNVDLPTSSLDVEAILREQSLSETEPGPLTPNDNEQSEVQILDATDHTPEQYPGS